MNYKAEGPDADAIGGIISMASEMASRTCECCGTPNDLGITDGWYTVTCKPCYDKKVATLGDSWGERNKWSDMEIAKEKFRIFHFILPK